MRPIRLLQYGATAGILVAPLVAYLFIFTGRYRVYEPDGWHIAVIAAYYLILLVLGSLIYGATEEIGT